MRTEQTQKAFRLTAQASLATFLTYGVSHAAGLPEVSWGILSALYVVQQSVGATLGTGVYRIVAALLGTAVGFAGLWLSGEGFWIEGVTLVAVTAIIVFMSGYRSGLRYGTFPAAVIVLAPRSDALMTDALFRAAQVGLGTLAGVFAALLIMPEPAHRAAARHAGNAVRLCGDLLRLYLCSLTGESVPREQTREFNTRILDELERAENLAYESRRPLKRRRPWPPHPLKLQRSVQHLWHSVVMIDRICGDALPEGPREELGPVLRDFQDSASRYFDGLGKALGRLDRPPPRDEMSSRLESLNGALDAIRRRGAIEGLSHFHAERVFVLAFALDQIVADLDRIACLIGDRGPQP